MNPLTILTTLAAGIGLRYLLERPSTLTWREVCDWVQTAGNPDNYGLGYSGNRLTKPRNAYIEVTRRRSDENWNVTAELILDVRLNKPANQKTWAVDGFDEVLKGRFGTNHRFRIEV